MTRYEWGEHGLAGVQETDGAGNPTRSIGYAYDDRGRLADVTENVRGEDGNWSQAASVEFRNGQIVRTSGDLTNIQGQPGTAVAPAIGGGQLGPGMHVSTDLNGIRRIVRHNADGSYDLWEIRPDGSVHHHANLNRHGHCPERECPVEEQEQTSLLPARPGATPAALPDHGAHGVPILDHRPRGGADRY